MREGERTPSQRSPLPLSARDLGRVVLSRRRWVIGLTLLFVAATGAGLTDLRFNPDSRLFFGEDNPERLALEFVEDTYSKTNNVLIILAPKNGDVFTRETLAVVEEVTERAWRTPYSSQVHSLANYQHSFAAGDEIIIEDLYKDATSLSASGLTRVREIALSSVQLRNRLISPQGDVTGVVILVTQPQESLTEVPEIIAFARGLTDEIRRGNPEIEVRLSGGVVADMAFAEAGLRDARTLGPVMIGIIFAMIWLGLRSWTHTVATILVVAFSVVTALGLAGWTGVVLSVATAVTPVIIMTLCVADCVHLLTTLAQQKRLGLVGEAAIVEALRINMKPIAITSLTTAVGFATLNFSHSPPLRELGNIVAMGVLAGFLYSVTFLPALLRMLPPEPGREILGNVIAIGRLAGFIIRHRAALILGFSLTFGLIAAGIGRITLDDNFINYFDESFAFRADTDFLENRLSGLHVLNYSLDSGEPNGITRPDYLETIDRFAAWFRAQDHVVHVSVFSDIMKRLNKNMHGDDPAHYGIPDTRDLAAQYLLFYEMSLPFGHELTSDLDIDRSASLANVRLAHVSSADIRRLGRLGEDWLSANAPDMMTKATGLSMMFAYISEHNIRSMLVGTLIALSLISFILIFALRSLRIGLLSLVPNLVPAAMAFGFWGYLQGEVTLAVSVVGAMTLGIVVDDTVHFLSKFLWARRELGVTPEEAIRQTFSTVGVALILTSIALVLGFGVLATSGFAISSQMGLLSAITIAVALVADLCFLPPLLVTLTRQKT